MKVLAFITRGEELLVFRQPRAPLQGTQVPGGSVEPGETFAAAALREAHEETGLHELEFRTYLGSTLYELKVDTGPPHLRHFVHLTCERAPSGAWQHLEGPSATRAEPVLRELWWTPLSTASLSWEMGALLPELRQALRQR